MMRQGSSLFSAIRVVCVVCWSASVDVRVGVCLVQKLLALLAEVVG